MLFPWWKNKYIKSLLATLCLYCTWYPVKKQPFAKTASDFDDQNGLKLSMITWKDTLFVFVCLFVYFENVGCVLILPSTCNYRQPSKTRLTTTIPPVTYHRVVCCLKIFMYDKYCIHQSLNLRSCVPRTPFVNRSIFSHTLPLYKERYTSTTKSYVVVLLWNICILPTGPFINVVIIAMAADNTSVLSVISMKNCQSQLFSLWHFFLIQLFVRSNYILNGMFKF